MSSPSSAASQVKQGKQTHVSEKRMLLVVVTQTFSPLYFRHKVKKHTGLKGGRNFRCKSDSFQNTIFLRRTVHPVYSKCPNIIYLCSHWAALLTYITGCCSNNVVTPGRVECDVILLRSTVVLVAIRALELLTH